MASGASNWASNFAAGFTHKAKKMPNAQISSADNLAAGNAARFRFIMTLNNFTYGFKSIGGLEVSRSLESLDEGGVNDHKIYVGSFEKADATLSLSRGMLLREWSALTTASLMAASRIGNNIARRAALMAIGATDAQYTLENGPAFGDIKVYNPKTLELSDWWTFMSLGITKRNPPDLDAEKSGADGEETLTLQVIDLKQRPVSWMPTNVSSMIGFFKDDGSEDAHSGITGRMDTIGSSYTGQEEGKGGALGLRNNLGSNYNNEQEENSEQAEKDEGTKKTEEKEKGEGVKKAEEKLKKEKEELKVVEDEIKADKEKLAEIERKGGGGALGLKNNLGSNYTGQEGSDADGEKQKQEILKLEEEKKAIKEKIKKAEEEAQKRRQAIYEAAKEAEEAKKRDKEQKNIEKAQKQKEETAMDKFIGDNT